MRKIKVYFRFFWPAILLILIGVVCWIKLSDKLGNFKTGLVSTALGLGITAALTEGSRRLSDYRRIKKTLAFLKATTVPYLQNQAINFDFFLRQNFDMMTYSHAQAFLLVVVNFDVVSQNFDKEWLQLIYSPSFIDALDSDDHFNSISRAISEVLIFTKTLSWHTINARRLLSLQIDLNNQNEVAYFVEQVKIIRNDVWDSAIKLSKYIEQLDIEIMKLFRKTGITYEKIPR